MIINIFFFFFVVLMNKLPRSYDMILNLQFIILSYTLENTRAVVTKVESMDSFPPIRYQNPKIDECLPEFCVNGYCRDLDDTDPDWMYRVYPSGKTCQCSIGYQGYNHCSWSQIFVCYNCFYEGTLKIALYVLDIDKQT